MGRKLHIYYSNLTGGVCTVYDSDETTILYRVHRNIFKPHLVIWRVSTDKQQKGDAENETLISEVRYSGSRGIKLDNPPDTSGDKNTNKSHTNSDNNDSIQTNEKSEKSEKIKESQTDTEISNSEKGSNYTSKNIITMEKPGNFWSTSSKFIVSSNAVNGIWDKQGYFGSNLNFTNNQNEIIAVFESAAFSITKLGVIEVLGNTSSSQDVIDTIIVTGLAAIQWQKRQSDKDTSAAASSNTAAGI